jgi:hypothetical protein
MWQFKVIMSELAIAGGIWKGETKNPITRAVIYGSSALTVVGIWAPGMRERIGAYALRLSAPGATAIAVPVAIGGVISAGIGGKEGIRNYRDFLKDVVTGDVKGVEQKLNVIDQELIFPTASYLWNRLDDALVFAEEQTQRFLSRKFLRA